MHDHVDVVEVDDIGVNRAARLVEELLEVVRALHLPPRHLGRDIYPVAPASGEGFAYRLLALAAEIDAPRVDVVHPALDGTAHHRRGLVEIHVPVLHWQSQHPEAQCRHVHARAPHRAVLHPRIVVEDVFRQLFPRHLPFGFLRDGFRTAHRSYGCGKKAALDKIPSIHILSFYLSKPINHAGLRRTSRSMSL